MQRLYARPFAYPELAQPLPFERRQAGPVHPVNIAGLTQGVEMQTQHIVLRHEQTATDYQ